MRARAPMWIDRSFRRGIGRCERGAGRREKARGRKGNQKTKKPGVVPGFGFSSGEGCGALGAARVDFLEHGRRGRGGGGGSGDGAVAGEAAAEEELFVFLVELEDLKDAGAGAFELVAGAGVADGGGGDGAESGEGAVEAFEERGLALKEFGAGHALVLAEETVFLEGALVKFVADALVFPEGLGLGHGVEAVLPSGMAGAEAEAGAGEAVGEGLVPGGGAGGILPVVVSK